MEPSKEAIEAAMADNEHWHASNTPVPCGERGCWESILKAAYAIDFSALQKEVEELRADNKILEEDYNHAGTKWDGYEEKILALQQENRRLKAALAGYDRRPESCTGEEDDMPCVSHMAYEETKIELDSLQQSLHAAQQEVESWKREYSKVSGYENSETLPRHIIELIYRSSCCKPTPEEAQKEPCACVAGAIIEQTEDWHNKHRDRFQEENASLKQKVEHYQARVVVMGEILCRWFKELQ